MKHFKYKVVVPDDKTAKKARGWCKKEFGPIPLVNKEIITRKNKYFYIGPVYDRENARWFNKVGEYNKKTNRKAFYFKNDEDALAFKLVWL